MSDETNKLDVVLNGRTYTVGEDLKHDLSKGLLDVDSILVHDPEHDCWYSFTEQDVLHLKNVERAALDLFDPTPHAKGLDGLRSLLASKGYPYLNDLRYRRTKVHLSTTEGKA